MKNYLTLYAFLIALVFNAAAQKTWFVNQSAAGTQTGADWQNAFHNLQLAINSATTGDSIWVAAGTYYPTEIAGAGTDPRDKTFLLRDGISLYGGFDGTELTLGERNTGASSLFGPNSTILSGDFGIKSDSSDDAYHVLTSINLTNGVVVDGFIITHGNASDSSSKTINSVSIARNFGGGVTIVASKLGLNRCKIRSNSAKSGGGGIYCKNSTNSSILNCLVDSNKVWSNNTSFSGGAGILNVNSNNRIQSSSFSGNISYGAQGGGAIRNENSSPDMDAVEFIQNKVIDGDGGGGIYNSNKSNPSISNVIFIMNYTNKQGAGMYNDDSKPIIEKTEFLQNVSDNGGGAMENDGGSDVTLKEVLFKENEAGIDGGAIQNWKSSPYLENVEFIGNIALQDGGGIFNYTDCSPIVVNCHFEGNKAGRNGGGIYNRRNCNPVMTNVLLIRNKAGAYGGGTYTAESNGSPCSPISTNVTAANNHADTSGGGGFDDGGGNSKLRNSIVYGNTSPGADDIDAPAALAATALAYSIIGTDFYINGTIPPTAISGQLFVDSANNDFLLKQGSAAIDIGDSTFFNSGKTPDLSSIKTDLRGADRIMSNNIDLGAYEYCTTKEEPEVTITASPDSIVMSGTTINFTATYSGAGANPTFEWYRNQNPLPGTDTNVFSLKTNLQYNGDSISVRVTSSNACTTKPFDHSNYITLNIVVGIKEGNKGNFYKLVPNPSRGNFDIVGKNLQSEEFRVQLLDLAGRVVFSANSYPVNNVIHVATEALNGIYLLNVSSASRQLRTSRVVILN